LKGGVFEEGKKKKGRRKKENEERKETEENEEKELVSVIIYDKHRMWAFTAFITSISNFVL
jgi:hypothetical protein